VELVGAEPEVWRRLELPSTLRLDELHGVLQAVFDWTDSHLHRFSLGEDAWGDEAEHFLCPYDVEDGEDDGVPARDVRLDEALVEAGDRLLYTYDYGDEWNHRLVVESVSVAHEDRATGRGATFRPQRSGRQTGLHDDIFDGGHVDPRAEAAGSQTYTAIGRTFRAVPLNRARNRASKAGVSARSSGNRPVAAPSVASCSALNA
jgi:hypothetical protein